jgi:hypothetical protein
MDLRLNENSIDFQDDGNIVFVHQTDKKKCCIGVIDIETLDLISFQEFDLGTILGRSWYGYPIYHKGRLYFNDSDQNIHIFEQVK